jgi:hypothetical protein
MGLEIESEHPKLILQAIRYGPKLSPWCWVSGSWVILAGIMAGLGNNPVQGFRT